MPVAEFKHPGEVVSLAVSPDGKHLAAAGTDRTVSIWQVEP
jgi:WD40 repeat protein